MLERAGLSDGLHFVNTTPYDEENQIKLDAFLDELQGGPAKSKSRLRRFRPAF